MAVKDDNLRYVGFYAPVEAVERVAKLARSGRYAKKSEVLRAAMWIGLQKLEEMS